MNWIDAELQSSAPRIVSVLFRKRADRRAQLISLGRCLIVLSGGTRKGGGRAGLSHGTRSVSDIWPFQYAELGWPLTGGGRATERIASAWISQRPDDRVSARGVISHALHLREAGQFEKIQ